MAQGHEDWNVGTSIDAQEIAELTVDIAAQTVGVMAIDVATQTIANLDMNFNAQSIGVARLPEYKVAAGDWGFDAAGLTSAPSGSETAITWNNDLGYDVVVELLSVRAKAAIINWTDAVYFDPDGDGVADIGANHSNYTNPIVFDPGIYIADGGGVHCWLYQESGSAVDMDVIVIYRKV